MISVGDISIHLINDANTLVDPGGAFGLIPRKLWSRYLAPTDDHMVPMTTTCLLVEMGTHKIIIDTGLGTKLSDKQAQNWHLTRPTGDLITALGRLNIKPDDITLVINTHLHSDHCSGNTHYDETGALIATFPNAEYVVQHREYKDANYPNERTAGTYFADNWQVIEECGQLRLLDGDTEILPGLWGVIAPGHTPGHMAIRFESKGKHAAYVCDLASYAIHFERLAWMTAYDVEPLVTLETKRIWQQWALQTDALLIFPHDSQRPAGHLKRLENGTLQIDAINETYV